MDAFKISPSTLNFPPPYDKVIRVSLKFSNESNEILAYKVKTTAPQRYFVRPSSGFVQPHESVDISIMRTSSGGESVVDTKDRFQVLTTQVTSDQSKIDIKDLWKMIGNDKSKIKTHLLVCTFNPETSKTDSAAFSTPKSDPPAQKSVAKKQESSGMGSVFSLLLIIILIALAVFFKDELQTYSEQLTKMLKQ